jgi:hypothetical protein
MLLSKAYLKLYSARWSNIAQYIQTPEDELDGSFIYSITGLLP